MSENPIVAPFGDHDFGGASAAFLHVRVPAGSWDLEGAARFQEETLQSLAESFSSGTKDAIRALPQFAAYDRYYRKFRKTYHVLLQFESLVLEKRPFPATPPAVRVMFLAEMHTFLLTAVHDLREARLPVVLGRAAGGEEYESLGGSLRKLKEGDLFMRDGQGIISSILGGPDQRTRIREDSEDFLYAVYAPQGISEGMIALHLDFLERTLAAFSPRAESRWRGIVSSSRTH